MTPPLGGVSSGAARASAAPRGNPAARPSNTELHTVRCSTASGTAAVIAPSRVSLSRQAGIPRASLLDLCFSWVDFPLSRSVISSECSAVELSPASMLRRSSRLVSPACAASSQPPPPPPPPAESRRPRSRSIQAAEPLAVPPAGKRPRPDLSSAAGRSHESKWWQRGCQRVAGVDEAGRGPLAGPLVAAACVLPPELHLHLPGMDDSKKLSEKEREDLYTALTTVLAVHRCLAADPLSRSGPNAARC